MKTGVNMDSEKTNSSKDITLYIEDHPGYVKSLFLCVGLVALVLSSTAIIVLRRTRRIPVAAKFLTTGLLMFDFMYLITVSLRKFITIPLYNTTLQVLSTTVLQLAYTTVTLMSLERFLMFYKPMKYMKICTERLVYITASIIWTVTVTVFLMVRYAVCYSIFESENVFIEAGKCNQIVTIYYSVLVTLVLGISTVCYWNIFNIVKKQLERCERTAVTFASTVNVLRTYKSTSLVLVYLLVIISTSLTYAIIIVFIRYMNLGIDSVRLSLETCSIVNCMIDPFLYVLWFKESQMEVCKLLARFSKKFQKKADDMKYEVFDIVTATQAFNTTTVD